MLFFCLLTFGFSNPFSDHFETVELTDSSEQTSKNPKKLITTLVTLCFTGSVDQTVDENSLCDITLQLSDYDLAQNTENLPSLEQFFADYDDSTDYYFDRVELNDLRVQQAFGKDLALVGLGAIGSAAGIYQLTKLFSELSVKYPQTALSVKLIGNMVLSLSFFMLGANGFSLYSCQ